MCKVHYTASYEDYLDDEEDSTLLQYTAVLMCSLLFSPFANPYLLV